MELQGFVAIPNVAYLGAAVLFILSLGGLSNQETARRGNSYGLVGMVIAIGATILLLVGARCLWDRPRNQLGQLDVTHYYSTRRRCHWICHGEAGGNDSDATTGGIVAQFRRACGCAGWHIDLADS